MILSNIICLYQVLSWLKIQQIKGEELAGTMQNWKRSKGFVRKINLLIISTGHGCSMPWWQKMNPRFNMENCLIPYRSVCQKGWELQSGPCSCLHLKIFTRPFASENFLEE